MKYVIAALILLLVVLHQDVWNWNNDRLVLGFLPVTLAYHAGISIAASITWLLAVQFAWPHHLEGESHSASESEEASA